MSGSATNFATFPLLSERRPDQNCQLSLPREAINGGHRVSQGFAERPQVRIFAVGSPHGDDQIGWRALERLQSENIPGVQLTALVTPLGLLDHLQGCRAVVLLDACRGGSPPGSIVRLTWPFPTDECPSASSHGFGTVATIALAESLGVALPRIT